MTNNQLVVIAFADVSIAAMAMAKKTSRKSSTKKSRAKAAPSTAIEPAANLPAVVEPEVVEPNAIEPAGSEQKDPDLQELAVRIRDAMGRVIKHGIEMVMACMDAGDDLIVAKRKVPHGKWMDWLEENCSLSDRTARVYIQLAEGRETIEQQMKAATELAANANFNLGVSANFTITRALGWIKGERANVVRTTARGAMVGARIKEERYLSELTPQEFLTDVIGPMHWPHEKLGELAELIAASVKPRDPD